MDQASNPTGSGPVTGSNSGRISGRFPRPAIYIGLDPSPTKAGWAVTYGRPAEPYARSGSFQRGQSGGLKDPYAAVEELSPGPVPPPVVVVIEVPLWLGAAMPGMRFPQEGKSYRAYGSAGAQALGPCSGYRTC